MTSKDKLQLRTALIGIALIPLTALSIYFINAAVIVYKWPCLSVSIVMATVTWLWAHTAFFYQVTDVTEEKEETYNPIIFGICVIPIEVMLLFSDRKALGIDSNPKMFIFLIFVLEIIHGFGFFFIQKVIEKYLNSAKVE